MFASSKEKLSATKDSMLNEGGSPPLHPEDIQNTVTAVKKDWEGVASRTGHQARKMADDVGHRLTDASESLTVKVRDKPIQSSLIALAVGFVMGRLLMRR